MRNSWVLFVFMLVCSAPNVAIAGLEDGLDEMFGSMTNVTSPASYEDQRRGAYMAGGVVVRNPIIDFDLVGFDPPRVDAGCGGIDFWGGSFSYINADQFIQALRAVAANAAGYAFQVALEAMCPTCAQTMDKLQNVVRSMNELASNSCEMAKKGVDSLLPKTPEQLSKDMEDSWVSSLSTEIGTKADAFSGWLDRIGSSTSPSKDIPEETLKEKLITGNVAWEVLTKANPLGTRWTNWQSFGDTELAEIVMSLTGSIVLKKKDGGDDKQALEPKELPALIGLEDLMGKPTEKAEILVYHCPGENPTDSEPATDCLNPEKVQKAIPTMVDKVHNILLGEEGISVGIVQKYVYGGDVLNDEEKSFVEILPEEGKRIRDLAIHNQGGAFTYARKATERIALELVSKMVNQILVATRIAAVQNSHKSISDFMRRLDSVEEKIIEEEALISQRLAQGTDLAVLYKNLMETGKKLSINMDYTERNPSSQDLPTSP